jgi:hypothetical protein
LGCLFLICWHYDKIKYILPFNQAPVPGVLPPQRPYSNKFPVKFFLGVVATVAAIVLFISFGFEVMPRNSSKDCATQFVGTNRTRAGAAFCNCIHKEGRTLDSCLAAYKAAPDDTAREK